MTGPTSGPLAGPTCSMVTHTARASASATVLLCFPLVRRRFGLALLTLASCDLELVGAGTATDVDPNGVDGGDATTHRDGTVSHDAFVPDDRDVRCTAAVATDLASCGGCDMACPAGSDACIDGKCYASLRASATVDGKSELVIQGGTVCWYHIEAAPAARATGGAGALSGANARRFGAADERQRTHASSGARRRPGRQRLPRRHESHTRHAEPCYADADARFVRLRGEAAARCDARPTGGPDGGRGRWQRTAPRA
jgi:hypothetical protein